MQPNKATVWLLLLATFLVGISIFVPWFEWRKTYFGSDNETTTEVTNLITVLPTQKYYKYDVREAYRIDGIIASSVVWTAWLIICSIYGYTFWVLGKLNSRLRTVVVLFAFPTYGIALCCNLFLFVDSLGFHLSGDLYDWRLENIRLSGPWLFLSGVVCAGYAISRLAQANIFTFNRFFLYLSVVLIALVLIPPVLLTVKADNEFAIEHELVSQVARLQQGLYVPSDVVLLDKKVRTDNLFNFSYCTNAIVVLKYGTNRPLREVLQEYIQILPKRNWDLRYVGDENVDAHFWQGDRAELSVGILSWINDAYFIYSGFRTVYAVEIKYTIPSRCDG